MMLVSEVLPIHSEVVMLHGGKEGVRDLALLESALARPYATFAGEDLYPTIIDKASALLESILINHPFVDGNKRTGYVLMRILLIENNLDIGASEDDKYEFVISICEGSRRGDEINKWIADRIVHLKD
jgi:death-on-curing protein